MELEAARRVISDYAVENANLKIAIAQLQLQLEEINKNQNEKEEINHGTSK